MKKKLLTGNICLVLVLLCSSNSLVSAKEHHVSKTGIDSNPGSVSEPFLTISRAAMEALPGDTVTVHTGTYREWVNPLRGGDSDTNRIVYRAAPGEKVEIKGSEEITGWVEQGNGIWKVIIPNSFFGDYNPYQDSIYGDWFYDQGRLHHTGEVFLNGKSLFEKENLELVYKPIPNTNIKDTLGSTFTWYCESDEENTTIWANFHEYNPNQEQIEISVRRTCFWPEEPGINYLTISGFHFSQAATQWGAPTAEQVGMISTHWNKGWIIENNVISDSKCSGITLGKERGSGHNLWSADIGNVNNDGNIHYIEVVFTVLRMGWNKEHIGSHIVRNNTIFNCEQTGICGSMGAAFSTIENNHIYNIWTKRQFTGAEIGGIKLHAPVDALIKSNRIHDTGRGLWLDWMTQGTRVTGNIFYNNDLEDLFIEVNHGPYLVDNNIFLSPYSLKIQSEGGAFVHNLITGIVFTWPEPNRFTPYFLPHSTDIKALTTIFGGDDRYYNNIFVGRRDNAYGPNHHYGLEGYNETRLPVWIKGNLYYNEARPSDKDSKAISSSSYDPGIKLLEEGEHGYLQFTFHESYYQHQVDIITTEILGEAKIPKALFDLPDGSPVKIDSDYLGTPRTEARNSAGPFSALNKGKVVLGVW
ncbi:MAG: right-handed parallel beta-helix repeat-containing protein [Bacteroidetes bacterium]|nr:MAG: right-handed parallel beta-helix repeat-containing protein [Bacteroidota bacterium]